MMRMSAVPATAFESSMQVSVVPQGKAVSELGHAAAKLAAENKL
jgi:hypothetical protein